MTRFNECVEIIFELEGYDETVVDSGGLTKWGISQRAFPDENIQALTKERAKQLYYKHYWVPAYCDYYLAPLDLCVFDAAVNQGQGTAVRMLQKAVGGLTIDGRVGPKTIARIQAQPVKELAAKFMARRALRYAETRHFDRYGYGWFARLFRVFGRS